MCVMNVCARSIHVIFTCKFATCAITVASVVPCNCDTAGCFSEQICTELFLFTMPTSVKIKRDFSAVISVFHSAANGTRSKCFVKPRPADAAQYLIQICMASSQ